MDSSTASRSDSRPEALSPAQIAKAALRRLAMQRLEPTPQNYARAWREEGGADAAPDLPAPARAGLAALAARALPDAPGARREPLIAALAAGRFEQVEGLLGPVERSGPGWSELIERALRHVERGSKQWTTARKKESLQRVLGANRSDARRLQERLGQLLNSWDSDTAEAPERADADAPDVAVAAPAKVDTPADASMAAAAATADAPIAVVAPADSVPGDAVAATHWPRVVTDLEATVHAALPAEPRAREVAAGLRELTSRVDAGGPPLALAEEIAAACEEARRVLQHRHHLVEQLGRLCHELTDGLGDLAEDDSWVRGQCEAMRGQLDDGLNARGVRSVSDLLHQTRLRQQQLRIERGQARDALKQLIHKMLQDIGELGEHTGRFHDNVGRYAEVIGRADSIESLAGTVREMVEETRTVADLVSRTQKRLSDEHARASELSERVKTLEDEIRRLSDEVGTDQLTKVANRRGLLVSFEAERARAERSAAPLAVALLDIDNFKKLNDTMGHQTGDEALKFLARRVKELLRPSDVLARYGGEEFVVLLPDTPLDESQQVLTRVQRQLSAELFMHENKQTFITFSAGTTLYRADEAIEAALERADEALYEAKRRGKNRTCAA